ncbi:hypothetical protein [Clavibacter michiganensis]|uniref:Uncharacterized protein n=1 Tax=Clavibacter michiganensis TaxID=28447 RepID=A0A251YMP5_9MICO|nr:hypothetical protein [Clavibacter michiganensis]OUE25517.1 hypothetical protein BFL37_05900 [Clavibacter michiganensis]
MTDDPKSSYSTLYDILFYANDETAYERDEPDNRKKPFEALLKRIDHALGGEYVKYATHNFDDALIGTAVAITENFVVRAGRDEDEPFTVTVTPLSLLQSISLVQDPPAGFVAHGTAWHGATVVLEFDSGVEKAILPGALSSGRNASEFAELYPALLAQLR